MLHAHNHSTNLFDPGLERFNENHFLFSNLYMFDLRLLSMRLSNWFSLYAGNIFHENHPLFDETIL